VRREERRVAAEAWKEWVHVFGPYYANTYRGTKNLEADRKRITEQAIREYRQRQGRA